MRTILVALGLLLAAPATAHEHAIAMHGAPALGPDYAHFPYADPAAPRGGRLVLSRLGGFDSLHPFIVRGRPAMGLGLTRLSLLTRSSDEPFTLYTQVADRVRTAPDRSWVEFRLRPGVRFHDGRELDLDDVEFSLRTLAAKGRPNHRRYYSEVVEIQRPGPRTIRLVFKDASNRELALILGLMPLLSRTDFEDRDFERVSLQPLNGLGPYRVGRMEPGRFIEYERIPGHWSEGLPARRGRHNFDVVRYEYFRDEDARLQAFLAGTVDVRWERDPRAWKIGYVEAEARGMRRLELPHGRPAGLWAFVFNARRPPFDDSGLRRALGEALDFPWINEAFYDSAHQRTESYFANAVLAAAGPPDAAERRLLAPFASSLPEAAMSEPWTAPGRRTGEGARAALRRAERGLQRAGWVVRDLKRVHGTSGKPLAFEILLARRADERLALTYARSLERLGIEVTVRTADSSEYQERIDRFDYDVIMNRWDQSLSPGTEQAYYWGTAAADQPGSRNYPAIRNAAVDAMIERLTGAVTREDFVTATRALDRALLWGEHVLPLFHSPVDRLAHWPRFARPATVPLYGANPVETWWREKR